MNLPIPNQTSKNSYKNQYNSSQWPGLSLSWFIIISIIVNMDVILIIRVLRLTKLKKRKKYRIHCWRWAEYYRTFWECITTVTRAVHIYVYRTDYYTRAFQNKQAFLCSSNFWSKNASNRLISIVKNSKGFESSIKNHTDDSLYVDDELFSCYLKKRNYKRLCSETH